MDRPIDPFAKDPEPEDSKAEDVAHKPGKCKICGLGQ